MARLFFEKQFTQDIAVGQLFDVDVILDSPEEVNAIQGRIVVPEGMTVQDIREGDSVIPFWIEHPHTVLDTKPVAVLFSGMVPGGYQEPHGRLFTLRVRAEKIVSTQLGFEDVKVLKHDGLGTPVNITTQPLSVRIITATGTPIELPIRIDVAPPESFVPQVIQDQSIFDGQWFAVFVTQDKGVGIDHYEIKEGAGQDGVWQSAESPYVLADQSVSYPVQVKAIDKAGNERIEVIPALHPASTPTQTYILWSIFGILVVMILVACVVRLQKKR